MSAKNQGYLLLVIGLVCAGIGVYARISRGRPGPDLIFWGALAAPLILTGLFIISPLGKQARRRKRTQLKRFLESED